MGPGTWALLRSELLGNHIVDWQMLYPSSYFTSPGYFIGGKMVPPVIDEGNGQHKFTS